MAPPTASELDALVALVPAKGAGGKSRLRPALSPLERVRVSEWMLERAVQALRSAGPVEEIRLISSDPAVASCARRAGVEFVREGRPHLNGALQVELDRCLAQGRPALILFADLPLIESGPLATLIERARRADLALAPDRARRGTNALLYRGPGPWRLRYGPHSFRRHWAQARARGLRVQVFEHPALACDLDTPQDWERLQAGLVARGFSWEVPAAA